MEDFNFANKLKARIKEIDLNLETSNLPLMTNETVPEPKYIEQPEGPLYSIYRRDPAGYNKKLFYGLTKAEADFKFDYLNLLEQKKRARKEAEMHEKGFEYLPEASELIMFDVVEMGTDQENPYWNPSQIIK